MTIIHTGRSSHIRADTTVHGAYHWMTALRVLVLAGCGQGASLPRYRGLAVRADLGPGHGHLERDHSCPVHQGAVARSGILPSQVRDDVGYESPNWHQAGVAQLAGNLQPISPPVRAPISEVSSPKSTKAMAA